MRKSFSISQKWPLLWLLLAAIIVISQPSCNTEKRVAKRLMKLDKDNLNTKRPWPYNYTYHEYVQMLDNAKIRQEFYRKRSLQARIAKDKRTQDTMDDNVKEYQNTIDRLEKDSQFHKIYKLREREILVKIKKEKKTQKEIEKQKIRIDKKALARQKEVLKRSEQNIKERQQRLNEKKKRLEDEKKEYANKNKANNLALKQKRKELSQLHKIADESGTPDDPNFVEGLNILTDEIQQLEIEKQGIEQKIDALTLEIEEFIEENYTPKDTVIKSQMILSTDAIPQQTSEKIKALPDSIK